MCPFLLLSLLTASCTNWHLYNARTIVQIGIHCGGWKKTQISEKIVLRWKHLANKCQASSVWFASSLPLGFRHFDMYRFWETLSYLCWYFCRTQRRVCVWVLKIIKHKHEWKQDVLNHNCLFGNTKHLVPISFFFFLLIFFFFICSQFCHTLKWKGLGYTCLPSYFYCISSSDPGGLVLRASLTILLCLHLTHNITSRKWKLLLIKYQTMW